MADFVQRKHVLLLYIVSILLFLYNILYISSVNFA